MFHRKEKTRKLLSLALSIVMVLGLLPVGPFAPLEALAADSVSYMDENGSTQTITDYTVINSTYKPTTWGKSGTITWYVVDGTADYSDDGKVANGITVIGNVNLILSDGCTLAVFGDTNAPGIRVTGSNSLTVYGQTKQTGKLNAFGGKNAAGIGGGFIQDTLTGEAGRNIRLNGGEVTVMGGNTSTGGSCAGIGSGFSDFNAENIYAANFMEVKAGTVVDLQNTDIIPNNGADLAGSLKGKRYFSSYYANYLTFTAQEAGSKIKLKVGYTESSGYLGYQMRLKDGNWPADWTSATTNYGIDEQTLANVGDQIRFRGFNVKTDKDNHFTMTGKIAASGDVTSLSNGYGGDENLTGSCYAYMFKDCTGMTTAPALPSTTLANRCYYDMFWNCTGLTTVPTLPATSMASGCYEFMFEYCTNITTAPALPAETLAAYCYDNMFKGCTGLTAAPALPATNLANNCYSYMFFGCTSLTAAPALPAKTLQDQCYREMFSGCTSLNAAPALPATNLASQCYASMFKGCTSLTSAPALPATTLAYCCYQSMFSGCTSLTSAPALPATTLAKYCYSSMFSGCTGLTSAPELKATILQAGCYKEMFSGCTSLTAAPALPAETLANYCCQSMFSGCTSLTAAPALPAETLAEYSYSSMFSGCTSLTAAPALPAETLADYCCQSMFSGCTSLTAAPALPAETLAEYCYQSMFSGCTSLTAAPALPAMTLAKYCYSSMFSGCTSLTSAPATLPAETLAEYCYDKMFSVCTSLTTAPAFEAVTLKKGCYREMFSGCMRLEEVPKLKATTLDQQCYYRMFKDCVSLMYRPAEDEKETNFLTPFMQSVPFNWAKDMFSGTVTPANPQLPTESGSSNKYCIKAADWSLFTSNSYIKSFANDGISIEVAKALAAVKVAEADKETTKVVYADAATPNTDYKYKVIKWDPTASGGNGAWAADDDQTEDALRLFARDTESAGNKVYVIGTAEDQMDATQVSIADIPEQTYKGTETPPEITPEPAVTFGDKTLVKDKDYTFSYEKNINAGTATIKVNGTGHTTTKASKSASFTIIPKDASNLTIDSIAAQTYTGSEIEPVITVKDGSVTLTLNTDYSVSYSDNVNAGTAAKATVHGKGNYTGTKAATFTINTKSISGTAIEPIPNQAYTGSEVKPEPVVKDGEKTLSKDTDYTLSYSGNVSIGTNTATVTVTGTGNYTGTKPAYFSIGTDITKLSIEIENSTYSGSAIVPAVTVKDGTKTLTKDTDYSVSAKDNVNVGKATATITGKGSYGGSIDKTFDITEKSISGAEIETIEARTYSGSALEPTPSVKVDGRTLVKDTDYSLSYKDNINIGTATVTVTAKGNYSGSENRNFTINAKSISGATVDTIADQIYTGSAIEPEVTVKDGEKTLVKGTDYSVSYSNNTNIGTAGVTVTGKGNYKETKDASFTIVQRSVSDFSVDAIADQSYTGSPIQPAVTVKHGTKTLVKNTDYTLSYSNNTEPGTATVTVTGMGSYTGTKNVNFTIVDNRPVITITAKSASKKYDGTELAETSYTVQGTLAGGDVLRAETEGTLTDVGTAVNRVSFAQIRRGDLNVTSKYNIKLEAGTLEITKRKVTLTSASDSKPYDGTALTNSNVAVTGDGFAEGEGADYTVTGSQTEVGTSKNAFTYVLKSGTKAGNYDVTKEEGTLSVGTVYKVEFETYGGTKIETQIIPEGRKVTKPANPRWTSHIFKGWYTEEACITEWDFEVNTVTEDMVLYAKWEETEIPEYDVFFNMMQHGDAPVATMSVAKGSHIERPDDPTDSSGYRFDGWFKDSSFTAIWTFLRDTVENTTTLYAKWLQGDYKVSYDVAPESDCVVVKGTEITLPEAAKEGCDFLGWVVEGSTFERYEAGSKIKIDEDTQFHAVFGKRTKVDGKDVAVGTSNQSVVISAGTTGLERAVADEIAENRYIKQQVVQIESSVNSSVLPNYLKMHDGADTLLFSLKLELTDVNVMDEKSAEGTRLVYEVGPWVQAVAADGDYEECKIDNKDLVGKITFCLALPSNALKYVKATHMKDDGTVLDENYYTVKEIIYDDGKVEKYAEVESYSFSEFVLTFVDKIPSQEEDDDNSSSYVEAKPIRTGTWGNPVTDGTWSCGTDGKWMYKTNAYFRNTWGYIRNPFAKDGQEKDSWFWFDDKGKLATGWQLINGKWYYLHPVSDGTLGRCWVDTTTPDGYKVDKDGAWVK